MPTESINAEFEAYVLEELGDVAVADGGKYISSTIQNYYKIWHYLKPTGCVHLWPDGYGGGDERCRVCGIRASGSGQ
jgi:hypothetical protein